MAIRLTISLIGVGLMCWSTVHAEDRVSVESKVVPCNAEDVVLHVRVQNDQDLMMLTVPLRLRAITPGAFPTKLRIAYGERVNAWPPMTDTKQYHEEDGECGDLDNPGFATTTHSDTLSHPVGNSPVGVLFAFGMSPTGLTPVLYAGSDMQGSLRLIFDTPETTGEFEIDTTCAVLLSDVYVSLSYLHWEETTPALDPGIVTIVACDCPYQSDLDSNGTVDAVDLAGEIDVVFFGEDDPQDPDCPATRSDFNADGTPDAVDLALLIDHVFFGGSGPISPCEW